MYNMFLFDKLRNRKDNFFLNEDTIILGGGGGGKSIPSVRHFCVWCVFCLKILNCLTVLCQCIDIKHTFKGIFFLKKRTAIDEHHACFLSLSYYHYAT